MNSPPPKAAGAATARAMLSAAFIGCLCAFGDLIAVHQSFLTTDRIQHFPARIWIVTPLLWIAFLIAVALIAIAIGLRRWLTAVLIVYGPGLVVAVKIAIGMRFFTTGVSAIVPLLVWLAILLPLAIFANRAQGAVAAFFTNRRLAACVALILIACGAITLFKRPAGTHVRSRPFAGNAPNVIVIFLDTFRADAMADAPRLTRFASSGRSYLNAYAPHPWTLPSHISMVTGYGAAALDIDYDHQTYAGSRKTLAEAFRDRGYDTAAIFANPYLNPDTGMARGFDSFEYSKADLDVCRTTFGFLVKAIPNARVPVCRMTAAQVNQDATALLGRRERPLFLALNYFDAHLPYYVPRQWRPESYRPFEPLVEYPIVERALRRMTEVPEGVAAHLRGNYAICVRYLDDAVGQLLERIDTSPGARPTIVAIVGDHGEQFGEHGLTQHGNSVYRQVLQVPLILHGPGIAAEQIATPVSTTDIYGTILEISGAQPRGVPLLPIGASASSAPVVSLYRAPRIVGLPSRLSLDIWSVIDGDFHLIRWSNGVEELYDLARDPQERISVSRQTYAASARDQLTRLLRSIEATAIHRSEEQRRLSAVGYLN